MLRLVLSGLLLAVAGCSSLTGSTCDSCPPTWLCDEESGCRPPTGNDFDLAVADLTYVYTGKQDLGAPNVDLAGCSPPCAGATPYCNASSRCVPCLEDKHCPYGTVCRPVGQTSACIPGCADDSRCSGGGTTLRCCAGSCIDIAKDKNNCGACGKACTSVHASASCNNGACMFGACLPGWGDCNAMAADDCETNLSSDPKNCGACGMACNLPNATAGCAHGCYIVSCTAGMDDCNGVERDGCEVDILSDKNNCGSCGAACAPGKVCKNANCM